MAKARKIYTDEAGNTLWEKKTGRGRVQVYAKNRQGKVVNEDGASRLMNESGYLQPGFMEMTSIEATSPKGRRMMKKNQRFF